MWRSPFGSTDVSGVRHRAMAALRGHGIAADLDLVELMLSELVTNAVRHAAQPHEIVVRADADAVRVSVRDASVDQPDVRPVEPLREGGNGMLIVATLSSRWGTEQHDDGKTVWFSLDRSVRSDRSG